MLTLGNGRPILPSVDLAALTGVVLKGMPGLAVVHALEDGHRVRLGVAELQTNVGELVLLAQRQRDGDILVGAAEGLGHPAGEVVRVVQVGEVVGRVAAAVVRPVAQLAAAHRLAGLLVRPQEAVVGRRGAAFAGNLKKKVIK